jgi:hypothetical protein
MRERRGWWGTRRRADPTDLLVFSMFQTPVQILNSTNFNLFNRYITTQNLELRNILTSNIVLIENLPCHAREVEFNMSKI